jgi:hypothetical protein
MFQGHVISIYVAAKAGLRTESLEHVEAIAGRGLDGDRYFDGTGHWSNNSGVSREITLIEIESIEALVREKNVEITPGAAESPSRLRVSCGHCAVARDTIVRALSISGRVDDKRSVGWADPSRRPASGYCFGRNDSGRGLGYTVEEF